MPVIYLSYRVRTGQAYYRREKSYEPCTRNPTGQGPEWYPCRLRIHFLHNFGLGTNYHFLEHPPSQIKIAK